MHETRIDVGRFDVQQASELSHLWCSSQTGVLHLLPMLQLFANLVDCRACNWF